jgi:hypothetical protein
MPPAAAETAPMVNEWLILRLRAGDALLHGGHVIGAAAAFAFVENGHGLNFVIQSAAVSQQP